MGAELWTLTLLLSCILASNWGSSIESRTEADASVSAAAAPTLAALNTIIDDTSSDLRVSKRLWGKRGPGALSALVLRGCARAERAR